MHLASHNPTRRRTFALSGYAVLGALTPTQALEQAMSSSGVTLPAATQSAIEAALASGQIQSQGTTAYVPGSSQCAAASGSAGSGGAKDLALVGSAGQLGLTTAVQGGLIASGPATLGITVAIAGIVGLFSTIMAHHAQAVAKEQNVLCSAVPAANNYLSIISQAVSSGQATPAEAIAALQSLSSDFDSAVSSIRKMGGSQCNAACVMTEELRAIIAYQTAQYQDMAAQIAANPPPASTTSAGASTAAAPVTSGSTMQLPVSATPATIDAATSSSLPSWFPIAAIIAGIFVLAEVL